MGWKIRWIGAILVAAMALAATVVVAETSASVADVIHGDRMDAKVADSGEVRVTSLQEGKWAHLGEFSLQPGAEYAPETRTEEEYLYVLRGSAVLAVGDRRFLVGPRMGVYLPGGTEVTWNNGPDELVAVQFFAGPSPGDVHDDWGVEDDEAQWPRPRIRPRPEPSELSQNTLKFGEVLPGPSFE